MFQSLLSWIVVADIQLFVREPGVCGVSILVVVDRGRRPDLMTRKAADALAFQSLFSWIVVADMKVHSDQCSPWVSVSILVVVDRGRRRDGPGRRPDGGGVSILVVVDRGRRPPGWRTTADGSTRPSFNP